MNYAIFRSEPIYTLNDLAQIGSHNKREKKAYNSNPNGAKSALDALSNFEGIKILVTPGMVELGDKEYESNFEFGVYATNVCDYIVLVGKEQTKPIYEGIVSTKYSGERVIVVDTLNEGLAEIDKIESGELPKVILLENDLPDNY